MSEDDLTEDSEEINDTDNELDQIIEMQEIIRMVKPSYSLSGEAEELPCFPGIFIDQFGIVSPPIVMRDSLNLINACKWAKIMENNIEVDSKYVNIRNPEWTVGLEKLVNRIEKRLGCDGKIQVDLKKLIS